MGIVTIAFGSFGSCKYREAIINSLSEEDNGGYIAEIKIIKQALTEEALQ